MIQTKPLTSSKFHADTTAVVDNRVKTKASLKVGTVIIATVAVFGFMLFLGDKKTNVE